MSTEAPELPAVSAEPGTGEFVAALLLSSKAASRASRKPDVTVEVMMYACGVVSLGKPNLLYFFNCCSESYARTGPSSRFYLFPVLGTTNEFLLAATNTECSFRSSKSCSLLVIMVTFFLLKVER
jgi:hypothetical protein